MKDLIIPKAVNTPVLIIGGGITGLSAALFLLQQGIKPLLIERHESTSLHPRAKGFDIRTMELMRELGIAEQIKKAGQTSHFSQRILTGKSLSKVMQKRQPKQNRLLFPSQLKGLNNLTTMSPETGTHCSQDLSEPILLDTAINRGAQIFFYTELKTFKQDDSGITALVRNRATGEETTIYADYMIAADGAKSKIREYLQVPTEGKGVLGHLLNVYFKANLKALVHQKEFSMLRIHEPDLKGMLAATNNSHLWTFQLHYDPTIDKLEDFTIERTTDILKSAIDIPQLDLNIISILPWQPTLRVVTKMQHGRIFLAGDAAHAMTPYGGKGANTGIQDVHNLAWKLAAVIRNEASNALLETYDEERLPIGRYNVFQSGKMTNKYGLLKKPSIKFALPFLNIMLINKLHLQHIFPSLSLRQMGNLFGLPNYQYFSKAIVSEEKAKIGFVKTGMLNGQPGTRMPHAWVNHRLETISTLDLLGQGFVLFTGKNNELWQRMAAANELKFGIKFPVFGIGKGEELELDNHSSVQKILNITESGAVLVRPDGFIAWRSDNDNAKGLLNFGQSIKKLMTWDTEADLTTALPYHHSLALTGS